MNDTRQTTKHWHPGPDTLTDEIPAGFTIHGRDPKDSDYILMSCDCGQNWRVLDFFGYSWSLGRLVLPKRDKQGRWWRR